MKELAEKFKEQGVALTPQRMAVMEFLKGNVHHPTAEEIYIALHKKYPSLSPATVYSTLELLRKIGRLQELFIRKDKACFDPKPEPHHHFLCRHCGKIWDIEVTCPILAKGAIKGHKIDEIQAYIYGRCSDCVKKK